MRLRLFDLLCLAVILPASAVAEGKPQPKFPPGFDCSAVAAGSQRQACNRSQLKPPMGTVPETRRLEPEGAIQQPDARRLPTTKPPTIPRLPGTIDDRR